MEYLVQNLDWLAEEIQDFSDDYLIMDCPGFYFAALNYTEPSLYV